MNLRCLFSTALLVGSLWLAPASRGVDLVIENVTLIDGTGRPPVAGSWVAVTGERVAAIGQAPASIDGDAVRVDGSGKFLIPGLIDSHIHLPGGRAGPGNREMIMDPDAGVRMLHGFLYSGVTSVYDSGNHDRYILKMRGDERSGRIVSPRIYATVSLIAPPGGHGCCAGGTTVANFEDGSKDVQAILDQSPDLLKFTREIRGMGPEGRNMPLLPRPLLEALITLANERGVRTTVHVSQSALARESIAAGANAFAHLIYLDRVNEPLANLMAARGVITSTTLTRNEADAAFFEQPLFKALLTPDELQAQLTHERRVNTPYAAWLGSLRANIFHNVRALDRAGAVLALGTDRTFGAMPHQELKLLVEAGIEPLRALQMGTLNAARYIGVDNDLGSIEVGKLADMVLLAEDPIADIGNTMTIEAVFKGGQRIDRTGLNVPVNRRGDAASR